jgi:ribosomal protein L7Ae-like RNA K-turn-binding protein
MNKKIYQLIGLCQKARKIVSGEFAVKQSVLDHKVFLVLVTQDASLNTKKLFQDKCAYRQIPCLVWGSREELGRILGKEERVVVGVTDEKLAYNLMEKIKMIE